MCVLNGDFEGEVGEIIFVGHGRTVIHYVTQYFWKLVLIW